jgi:ligand-binding sensor domain-containing protein/anti-sigma regulatory factor (Ser/Thr protein kinase)
VIRSNALLIVLLLTLPVLVRCQEMLWFHQVGKAEGLLADNLIDIYVDSEGLTWIAAVEGLFNFDGQTVKQYFPDPSDSLALKENYLTGKFCEDAQKNIWFSTLTAIHCYNRKSNDFRRYTILNKSGLPISEGYTTICLERDTFLWLLAGEKEIYRFNIHSGIQSQALGRKELDIAIVPGFSPDGQLKYLFSIDGVKSEGLELFTLEGSGQRLNKSVHFGKNIPGTPALFVSSVIFEQDTAVWLAANSSIFKWNLLDNSLNAFQTKNSGSPVIAPYSQEVFIVTESGRRYYLFNKRTNHFSPLVLKSLNDPTASLSELSTSPQYDHLGNLWLSAAEGQGLLFSNTTKTKLKAIPKIPLLIGNMNYNYRAITQNNKKQIWCSTFFDGILLLDEQGNLLRQYHSKHPEYNSIFNNQANHILLDKSQQLWVGTPTGVALYTAQNDRFQAVYDLDGKQVPYAVYFYQLNNGDLLVSTLQQGVYKAVFTKGKWRLKQILTPANNSDLFTSIFQDSEGTIYINHKEVDMKVFNYFDEKLAHLGTISGLGTVNGFYENPDGQTLWMATSNGLAKVHKKNLQKPPVIFTEKNGLSNNNLQSMLVDQAGDIWLGTSNGLVKFHIPDSSFFHFTLADGMQSTSFSQLAAFRHSDGSLWFGGDNGITIVPAEGIKMMTNEPVIHIKSIEINSKKPDDLRDEQTGATNINQIGYFRRPSGDNDLLFEFEGIDYSDPAAVVLEYKMEKVNSDWVRLGKGEKVIARFPNLSHGTYVFQMRAYNSDGTRYATREIRFTINTPLYLTPLAIFFYCLAFISALYAAYKIRVNQIRKKEATLRKEAEYQRLIAETETAVLRLQMNPHFIFNSMNSISSYILEKDINTANDYLGRFAKLMRMILKFAAKPLISVADEIDLLEQYMQTEAMRVEKAFTFNFEYDNNFDPDDYLIPTMILQPFVENAIWHGLSGKGEGGHIRIRFWTEGHSLNCSVEDNGIGREAAAAKKPKDHESKALSITEHRLGMMERKNGVVASYRIEDIEEGGVVKGTRVLFCLPLL